MSVKPHPAKPGERKTWPDWHQALKRFRDSSNLEATFQLLNTIVPYFALWYLMVRSIQLGYSYVD
jgi:acyl-lipid omega-6 desaturase (Delta-12 desaturase)